MTEPITTGTPPWAGSRPSAYLRGGRGNMRRSYTAWLQRRGSPPGFIAREPGLGPVVRSLWTPSSPVGRWVGRLSSAAAELAAWMPSQLVVDGCAEESYVAAAFPGTPGPRQKVSALIKTAEGWRFRKSSALPAGIATLEREARALEQVRDLRADGVRLPRLETFAAPDADGIASLFTNTPSLDSKPGPLSFDDRHITFLRAMANRPATPSELESALTRMEAQLGPRDARHAFIARSGCELVRAALRRGLDTSAPAHPAHGDFAPWNTRSDAGALWVIDWEDYQPAAAAGLDLVHFTLWFWVLHGGALDPHLERARQLAARTGLSPERPWLEAALGHALAHWVVHLQLSTPPEDVLGRMELLIQVAKSC